MRSVLLRVASDGVIWVLSTCQRCDHVTEHLAADAIVGTIACGGCGHPMDMKYATIAAVAAARDRGPAQSEA